MSEQICRSPYAGSSTCPGCCPARKPQTTPAVVSHAKGPWAWRQFGGRWMLVGDYGPRPVVLIPSASVLETRNSDGILIPLTPEHPNARLIAAAPEMLKALIKCAAELSLYDNANSKGSNMERQRRIAIGNAYKAIAKAEGRES